MTDLSFAYNGGTLATCTVMSSEGMEWVDEHVALEGWQWLGNSFAVEPRYVMDLLEGAKGDGLECEVAP